MVYLTKEKISVDF